MRIHQLDRYYQEGLHRIELVNRDETERRLSLKTLALRDANAALQDLASEKELHISSLGESIETLKIELLEAQQRSSEQHSGLEKQRNEIRSLKVCLLRKLSGLLKGVLTCYRRTMKVWSAPPKHRMMRFKRRQLLHVSSITFARSWSSSNHSFSHIRLLLPQMETYGTRLTRWRLN